MARWNDRLDIAKGIIIEWEESAKTISKFNSERQSHWICEGLMRRTNTCSLEFPEVDKLEKKINPKNSICRDLPDVSIVERTQLKEPSSQIPEAQLTPKL